MAVLKSYLLTIENINYALHLEQTTYDGIKDALGLKDIPSPPPDPLRQTSTTELEKNGLPHKISIGLATTLTGKATKRKIVICPSTKPFKNLIGKQVGTLYVKSACVRTHRNFIYSSYRYCEVRS